MASITKPLIDEHKALYRQVENLRFAGDAVGESLTTSAHDKIEQAYDFLTRELYPHAQAEDQVLYPIVQKIMDSPLATATMSRDHMEVERLTQELGSLRVHKAQLSVPFDHAMALRRVLYSLYALIKLHFAKEEEIYLPLLDSKLTEQEAHEMFEKMDAVEQEIKASLPR